MSQNKYLAELLIRYPRLAACENSVYQTYQMLLDSFANQHKLLVAGNGGSCADAEHLVGELMKGFCLPRLLDEQQKQKLISIDDEIGKTLGKKLQGALPTLALTNHNALNTAYLNDVDGLYIYAQQVYGYGQVGDVFLGISTSGNSKNILNAAVTAKAKQLKVIGLTGENGGRLKDYCDVCICVPETETFKVQELHLPVYHCLALMLEEKFFGK
ncbi:SIS domain-containing protein [bacterium]|nr:SIS domain-containing protein [bacterium]